MAGIQSCLRNVLVNNSLRVLNKNGVLLQSTRNRHVLVFQLSLPKNTQYIKKSKLLLRTDLTCVYRLASTNVTQKEGTVTVPETNTAGTVNTASEAVTPTASNIVIDEASLPPVPSGEEITAALEFVSTGLKEPSFESLGLGSWWPPGILQQILEYLHITVDLPWWGAIAVVTFVFRMLLFPFAVMARRNAVNMNNNLPQLQLIQIKLTEARHSGNYYDAAFHSQELMNFMKEKNIATVGSLLPSLAQAPIFISMYLALKKMAAVPVESLQTGGLYWFSDLTVPDPFYILPIFTASSLLLVIELGADGVGPKSLEFNWMKYAFRLIPFVILPFTVNLPAAVLWYWTVSNTITVATVGLFKIKPIRQFFNVPVMIKHDPKTLPIKKKGAVAGFKEGMANAKLIRELEERERLNTITFEGAGKGPVQRTFKRNPKEIAQKAAVKMSQK